MCSENPLQVSHWHATYLITIESVTPWLVPPINNNINNIIIYHSITERYHWFSKSILLFNSSWTEKLLQYLFHPDWLYKLLKILFYPKLNTQVIINSIVHVWKHIFKYFNTD